MTLQDAPKTGSHALFGIFSAVAKKLLSSPLYRMIPQPIKNLGFTLFARLKPQVAEVDGHSIHLNPEDRMLSHHLLFFGIYEEFETELFKQVVKPGMTVLDIGANIGYYTVQAARAVGEQGHVYAFEPDPNNHEILRRNLEINGYRNVTAEQKAVSNKTDEVRLYIAKENKGDHRVYDSGDQRLSIPIDAVRLDDYLEASGHVVDVVKMDIQGAEFKALQSMHNILQKNDRLVLFTEYSPAQIRIIGDDPINMLEILESAGFHFQVIDEQARKLVHMDKQAILDSCHGETYVNLLCAKGSEPFVPGNDA